MAPSLPRLSGERVQGEVFRLLRAPDPVPVVRLMIDHDILAHLLPEATGVGRLAFVTGEAPGQDDAVFRLAAGRFAREWLLSRAAKSAAGTGLLK